MLLGLAETVANESELNLELVKELKGDQLENFYAQHPFIESRKSRIILGDHVTLEAGTGAVHTAPGHGTDDYFVGKRYGLEVLCPVDEYGKYTKEVPEYEGERVFDVNPKIVARLEESGHLLAHKSLRHSYPYCWRSKTPLIYRTTPQWFVGIDMEHMPVRNMALDSLEKINFYPDWGQQRFKSMVENRPDWCISRQRNWGVPIPVLFCKATGKALIDSKIMHKVADKMESGRGIEEWWDFSVDDLLEGISYKDSADPEFGSQGFKKGTDTLDVWFDSGICHTALQEREDTLENPADIYLEGSDQHRGWFNTSMISAIAAHGKSPFKGLVTHGFVLDQKGRKMSKSLGNTIDPAKVINQSGAEILRLWSAYEDYGQDLTVGPEIFSRVTETYRRLRNTMRFLLGNLGDFNPETDQVAYDDLNIVDKWALHRLNVVIKKCEQAYEEYDFYKVYHALNNYFTVELSAQYLDILKDRLYTAKTDGNFRRGSQTVLLQILSNTMRLMAPILSFLAEEVYSHYPQKKQQSVFLERFPEPQPEWQDDDLNDLFTLVLKLREDIYKQLEELRAQKTIRSSLEAKVIATVSESDFDRLTKLKNELREIMIVSHFELKSGEPDIETGVAEGEKCPRCWHIHPDLNSSSEFPGVCPKCVAAL